MKTKMQQEKSNFDRFLNSEIKKPEVIQGGTKGPIERDKLRKPRHG